jgi:DNA-binding response OmpR family regulator
MRILIIEDETELLKNMLTYLKAESYACESATAFAEARDKLEQFSYDIVLLDINLPGGNGLTLLQELKKDKRATGVIIISARNSIDERIKGLNEGADDYLSKPFNLSELNARISAVIRRQFFQGNKVLVFNAMTIDLDARTVTVCNSPVFLTRKEYGLLIYLACNKNRVISKNAIAEHLSGEEIELFDSLDYIYTHIKNLKRKLRVAGDYIKSIYGMGYKFEV